MDEENKNREDEKEQINEDNEMDIFFKNGKLLNTEDIGSKEEFKEKILDLIEKHLKFTNNYFLIIESFWFKDICYTEQLKKIILEKNEDLKIEVFMMNYCFITYDGLVYEKYKSYHKGDILKYLSLKLNKGFTVDLMDLDEDELLINNNELSDEESPDVRKKIKYKLPVIKKISMTSITHNSVTLNLPKVSTKEFREKNSLYREDDKELLKYLILLYDRQLKKYQIKENSHYKQNFIILDLIPNTFYMLKIVLFYEEGNSYGKPSRPFYFFTKSSSDIPNHSFYSWGCNKYNICFSLEEQKIDVLNTPLKFSNNDINQIDNNNDNIYLVSTSGKLISNGKTYCDENMKDNFSEIKSEKVKDIFIKTPFIVGFANLYVMKIACGIDSLAILTNSGKLYTMGYNDAGQLGLNYPNDLFINTPKEVKFHDINDFVVDIVGGDKHYMALIRNLELNIFTWGMNQGLEPIDIGINTVTGLDLRQSKIPIIKSDFLNRNIIKIYAKSYYSAIFTLEKIGENKFIRNVYTFGQNSSMLGNSDLFGVPYINVARIVDKLKEKDVIDISFGETHTLFLVNDKGFLSKEEIDSKKFSGVVYGCGTSRYGELGLTCDTNYSNPIIIKDCPPNIKCISAGKYNSILVDTENNIIFYGKKSGSFCGNPNLNCTKEVETNYFFNQNKINVEKIINGDKFCIALTK